MNVYILFEDIWNKEDVFKGCFSSKEELDKAIEKLAKTPNFSLNSYFYIEVTQNSLLDDDLYPERTYIENQ